MIMKIKECDENQKSVLKDFNTLEIASSNSLFWGDNLKLLKRIPSNSIDLVYLDPPFFTNRTLKSQRTSNKKTISFEDKWGGELNSFINFLKVRLVEVKRVLKDSGNIVLHLDQKASHYMKIEMDNIFGYDNFQNEIIWSYRTGGASKRRFSQKHDNLLWYSKNKKEYFYKSIPERVYYEKPFFNPKQDSQGRYYADVLPVDTWDMKAVLNISSERVGYPTQKPEKLIEKIICSLCPEGGLVADFFSGGGTTAAVAQKLGRNWLACDESFDSIDITKERLSSLSAAHLNNNINLTNIRSVNYEFRTIDIVPKKEFDKMGKTQLKKNIAKAFGCDDKLGEFHYKGNIFISTFVKGDASNETYLKKTISKMKDSCFRYGILLVEKKDQKKVEKRVKKYKKLFRELVVVAYTFEKKEDGHLGFQFSDYEIIVLREQTLNTEGTLLKLDFSNSIFSTKRSSEQLSFSFEGSEFNQPIPINKSSKANFEVQTLRQPKYLSIIDNNGELAEQIELRLDC